MLLIRPLSLTQQALGVLSRNKTVIAYTDGSASVPAGAGGLGIVMKFGRFTVEISRPIMAPVTAMLAELFAIEQCLDLIPKDRRLVIKSDAKGVVGVLVKGFRPRLFKNEVERVKSKLNSHNANLLWFPKNRRVGTPHSRADRLALYARRDGREFLRIRQH